MRLITSTFTLAAALFGQSTGPANTKGSCSPAVTGSGNTISFNVTNCGMSEQQVQEFRSLFRQVLENQVDPKVLKMVLDDISGGLIRIENGVLRIEQKIADRHLTRDQKELLVNRLSSLPRPRVNILIKNGNAEVDGFLRDFRDVFEPLKWAVDGPSYDMVPSGARGLGVIVKSQTEHPGSADVLIKSLREMGFAVEASLDGSLASDQMRLAIGSK